MGATRQVLMCLPTLVELVRNPKKNNFPNSSRSRQRISELESLQESIDSGKVLVYVPPVLVSQLHFAINSELGIKEANAGVRKLLSFAICNLDVDYDSILRKANACVHDLENADLYDVIGLACAEVLNADAFIAARKDSFRKIVDSNYREFPEFSVLILDVNEFIQTLTHAERQYRDDENSVYVYTPKLDEIKLPCGATPVDFAYKIHTRLGDRCLKAIVKGVEVPLNQHLQTGDVVEIIKGQEDCLSLSINRI